MNTLADESDEVVEINFSTDRGTRSVRVLDAQGHEIPSQPIPTRRYSSSGARRHSRQRQAGCADSLPGRVAECLHHPVPRTRAGSRLEPIPAATPHRRRGEACRSSPSPAPPKTVRFCWKATSTVFAFDPARGGVITSLLAKKYGKEFCDPSAKQALNEYRGYFIEQKRWRSSTEQPATVSIIENGPMQARVRISGQVGGVPCQTMVDAGGRPAADRFSGSLQLRTRDLDRRPVGYQAGRSPQRTSPLAERWPPEAAGLLSGRLRNQSIYKNAAYDVCKSRNTDTFFQRWDEIKHNIHRKLGRRL